MEELLAIAIAYLVGSIPFAFLLTRRRGIDLRHVGSGNVGASNVLRTSGVRTAVLAMVLDAREGVAGRRWSRSGSPAGRRRRWRPGWRRLIGHIYPVWLRFRGGKGVATAAGVFAVLTPVALGLSAAVFLVAVWVTRYISVGSMVGRRDAGHCGGRPATARRSSPSAPVSRPASSCIDIARTWPGCWRVPNVASASGSSPRHRTVSDNLQRITVLGAGGWGTALAVHLSRVGHDARLWARDGALVADMHARRANAVYLPDVTLPRRPAPSAAISSDALDGADIVVSAVPSHGTREIIRRAAPALRRRHHRRQRDEGARAGFAVSRVGDHRAGAGRRAAVAVLSGPSFASEVARAAADGGLGGLARHGGRRAGAGRVPVAVLPRSMAPTTWSASRLAARCKNVIAIAAGVAEGLGLGSQRAGGLITRGLAEISRLACAAGAQRETLAGLTGLGDLVLDLHRFARAATGTSASSWRAAARCPTSWPA